MCLQLGIQESSNFSHLEGQRITKFLIALEKLIVLERSCEDTGLLLDTLFAYCFTAIASIRICLQTTNLFLGPLVSWPVLKFRYKPLVYFIGSKKKKNVSLFRPQFSFSSCFFLKKPWAEETKNCIWHACFESVLGNYLISFDCL